MDNMEYIDDYFKSNPTSEEKHEFEQRILHDNSFAEDVAFYISANGALKEQLNQEKKQRFREIYNNQQNVIPISKLPYKKIWRYMAAASLLAVLLVSTWILTGKSTSSEQLADQYIQDKLDTLSVSMGTRDSLQSGLGLYNSKKMTAALAMFETLAAHHPENSDLKKYAGIASLKLGQYDKALNYFSLLTADTSQYSNFGKFYEAVTLLKRNKTGDVDSAKKLLQAVVDNDQEGKEESVQWLKKLK